MDREQFIGLLDIAIEREVEAFDFYNQAAKSINNRALAQIFQELAEEEKTHRELLESYQANPEQHFEISAPLTDYRISEEMELPPLSITMKPADAFALAMKKEQQAAEFYQNLASRAVDDEVKEMCLNLSNMELKHKKTIEDAYVDIAFVESF